MVNRLVTNAASPPGFSRSVDTQQAARDQDREHGDDTDRTPDVSVDDVGESVHDHPPSHQRQHDGEHLRAPAGPHQRAACAGAEQVGLVVAGHVADGAQALDVAEAAPDPHLRREAAGTVAAVEVQHALALPDHDVAVVASFDDLAGLDAYQVHPEHQAAAAAIRELVTARAAIDWQS